MYVSLIMLNNQYDTKLVYIWFGLELSLLMVRITIHSGLLDRVKFNLVMFNFLALPNGSYLGYSLLSDNGVISHTIEVYYFLC